MAGMQMDVNDVEFDAYLANDRTLDDPEVTSVEPGGRVRLRVIVGTASTNFFLDLGALEGELIAVDGQPILPIRGRRFPMAMAQRIDVRLQLPAGEGAYPILAQREDDTVRTGIVLATRKTEIRRIDENAAEKAGIVGLELERQLQPLHPLKLRPVDRRHNVILGGDMDSYTWTINGAVFGQDVPLPVALGERVELVMRNDTEMAHPMHLHGTVFQVVEIDGKRINGARRDTVMVPGKATVTVAFDADNAGRWAFHCHNSYHQEAGMMTSVEYV
jgi:FtsP/CotA-like multicopper oxidase with cupredoxin domain